MMTIILRRVAHGLAVAALAVWMPGTLARAQGTAAPAVTGTVLDFHVMVPVTGPFVGSANPIRGVAGGGLPWALGHGDGTLRIDGQLEVNVTGLVLANDPSVPQNQRGTNPSPTFQAIVSCVTVDQTGAVKETNVTSDPAPATPAGDARIQAKLALPTPCLAPIVFVAGPNSAWFAIGGR